MSDGSGSLSSNVDGIDLGGTPSLPVSVEASVEAVFRVALLKRFLGMMEDSMSIDTASTDTTMVAPRRTPLKFGAIVEDDLSESIECGRRTTTGTVRKLTGLEASRDWKRGKEGATARLRANASNISWQHLS